ncbi:TetR/AcrR family transcriptional regulator [Crossiella sp. CA198]|uniref:TetR/AcrR family transcriptional regulator n=1 Tax=Crossiella sp. CA198 TaxID=3455607 RepID=UPI003F8CF819
MDSAKPEPGLRERKKAATRDALSWAAIKLAVERGLENVLVEDIAAEAGVSARTFNNYFGSKAEAIASRHLERARQIAVRFRECPAGQPLWAALTESVLGHFRELEQKPPDPVWQAGVRLMTADPSLTGEFLKASAQADHEFALAIAERTGTDLGHDLYPRLVASAVSSAIGVATEIWMHSDPPRPVIPLIADALAQVSAGLPAP